VDTKRHEGGARVRQALPLIPALLQLSISNLRFRLNFVSFKLAQGHWSKVQFMNDPYAVQRKEGRHFFDHGGMLAEQ